MGGGHPIGTRVKECRPSPRYPILVRSKHYTRLRASKEWTKHFTQNVVHHRSLNCLRHGGLGVQECLPPVLVKWMLVLWLQQIITKVLDTWSIGGGLLLSRRRSLRHRRSMSAKTGFLAG